MIHNKLRFACPRRKEHESIVQDGLAYTPTQMLQLAEKGIAVSTNSVSDSLFFDGVPKGQGSFDLPVDMRKGFDVADAWQASQTIRAKAKKGLKRDIELFGASVEEKGVQ